MLFCKHNWKIISEHTTESPFEHALRVARGAGVVGRSSIPYQMCDTSRKFIQVVQCEKCGKLKRFVENI